MRLTDEEFDELNKIHTRLFACIQLLTDEDKGLNFYLSTEEIELIYKALTRVIEEEIDKRREKDKVKSLVEQILEKPIPERFATKLEPKSSCKYELPCGRCDLTKSLCSYNYEVKTDGNDI